MNAEEERNNALRASPQRELGSPFLEEGIFGGETEDEWEPRATALVAESPFQHAFAQGQALLMEPEGQEEAFVDEEEWSDMDESPADETEGYDEEDGAYAEVEEAFSPFETEADSMPPRAVASSPVGQDQRTWILARDRSAIERLPNAEQRRRFLEQVNWSRVEFPGNGAKTPEGEANWQLADALFSALAGVTPERRVPFNSRVAHTVRFHDVDDVVVSVPGQLEHKLFPAARDAFVQMRTAAAADGVQLTIRSAWRDRKRQAKARQNQPNPKAVAKGVSAHMYGAAVDLRMSVPGLQVKEANTRTSEKMGNLVRMYRSPVYKWMALRGSEFGWYPYRREPWHWEYNPMGFKDRFEGAALGSKPGTTAPQTPTSASPSSYLGGKLTEFTATTPIQVAVFSPKAASTAGEVDLLVYVHGLLSPCSPAPQRPADLITKAPFALGKIVDASNRQIILAVPFLAWKPRQPHPLGDPAKLNRFVDEVLAEVGRMRGTSAPSLHDLILAGHSRAYDFLDPLAKAHTSSEMTRGALSRLTQVWAFDTAYTQPVGNYQAWFNANPKLVFHLFYRKWSYDKKGVRVASGTKAGGEAYAKLALTLAKRAPGRFNVKVVAESHCAVPVKRLPDLLAASVAQAEQEIVEDFDEQEDTEEQFVDNAELFYEDLTHDHDEEIEYLADETEDDEAFGEPAEAWYAVDRFDPVDELDADEAYLSAEAELDARAYEALGDDEEHTADDEDEACEFEDEDYADQALEEEASDKRPLPIPVGNPVPFAPLPGRGSYWPLRTSSKDARVVSYMYQAPSGIVGRAGRMFLAGRTGKRDGKQTLRWHVGVDLFANIKDVVVACEDGTIVNFSFFYKAKSGQRTYRLLIQHDGSGVVVNYGEVTADSLRQNGLKVGDRVTAGQPIGFVSDTSMLHFETYSQGTTASHQWWKDEKTLPRPLLNPTRYLLFLREHGLSSTQDGGTQPAPARPASPSTKPPAELVRFAQRVLNAAEGERLGDDGDLGRLTRTALERFRKKYNLGAGGVLDTKTELALAQRALEEIAQQSLFAQPGMLDAQTEQALTSFKAERRLRFGATLDAATRAALTDALARRVSVPSPTVPRVTSSGLPNLGAGVTPPADSNAYRKFRLTTYHVVDQREVPTGSVRIPIYDDQGRKIAEGSPAFFAQLSLEGTARLTDGRLINVTGKTVSVSHGEYAEVLAYHRQAYAKRDQQRREDGQEPTPTKYSGIVAENNRVVRSLAFHAVPTSRRGIGYGLARGIPYVPFRTLAADIGMKEKHDKDWKGKGGLVPPGTHVYIKEYKGLRLPDGTTHDGWFVVNDTGGGIFGAHFDVFVGTQALRKQVKLPEFGQVWFAGIEQRIPSGYTYGIKL